MQEFTLTGLHSPDSIRINYEGELNSEQFRVVTEGDGPTLVLAGAGSGKTRAITYRVAWLLEHNAAPEHILLLTFTNKAAKEMITRVEELLKTYPTGLWAGTFHSIANRLLRIYGDRTPYGRDFSILDEDDAEELMKLCAKELGVAKSGMKFPSGKVLKGIASFAVNSRCAIPNVIENRHSSLMSFEDDIVRVIKRYEEEKIRQRAMDFDDLLKVLLDLLQTDPGVKEALARRFHYVMVDEFQDTNIMQAELVDLLSSTHRNLLVVGDDAQSIYSFRAAEIRNILEFPKRYEGAKTFHLLTNYRSTPQILDVANAVIAHNEEQFEKSLIAHAKSGDKPLLVPAADERQEAQYIAEQILTWMGEGTSLSSIAVLFRAAFHSQALEFELMKRNIPYEYRGGLKFFERAHIKDALAHLRAVRNPRDGMAWIRLLRLHPGFGLATAGKVAERLMNAADTREAIATPVPLSARNLTGWQRVTRLFEGLLKYDTPSHMIRALAGTDWYQEYLAAEYQNPRDRLEDLEQFSRFAEQYDTLGAFLDAVTLTADFGALADPESNERQDMTGDRLILSTVHQAKGLEWDTVFMINLAEGAFPHGRAYGEEGGMSEERRLFYVAATRARRRLIFSYPLTAGYESVELKSPSPFLGEVPKGLLEEVRLRMAPRPWQRVPWSRPVPVATVAEDPFLDDGEPTISLDANGEPTIKKSAPSFLGDY